MSKHRKCNLHSMQCQRGAVAIIVAICLVLLVSMLGLVLDLGHLYVTRAELQNAADSSSLSGAKELNGKATGINSAITREIEAAGKNKIDLKNANYAPVVGLFPFLNVQITASTVTMPA